MTAFFCSSINDSYNRISLFRSLEEINRQAFKVGSRIWPP
ncbi:hypothetical protein ADIS_2128 [Lunatimonas lonarensis]|uniref:Uncharacterized protein n=1 Tax=Lunatimonas lonarensis TaxID=1232681 RepID=R7ZSZ6_9BACT|nr:hypothetical protein ADIS_2128 [Lunatimonas lonarensis]